MRRTGVVITLVMVVTLSACITPVSSVRLDFPLTWQNGLIIEAHMENFDYWVVDEPGLIFIRLTLNNPGTVIYFGKLEFTFIIEVSNNVTFFIEKESQFNQTGDYIDITQEITFSLDNVTLTDDSALIKYYFQFNLTVRLDRESELREYYTYVNGPLPINLSTQGIVGLWPYPPIFLLAGLYWGGFLALRKFNSRYKEVLEATEEIEEKKKSRYKW